MDNGVNDEGDGATDDDGDNGDGATDDDVDEDGYGGGAMDDDGNGNGATDDNVNDDNNGDDSNGAAANDNDDDVNNDNLPPCVGKRNDGCDETKTEEEETVADSVAIHTTIKQITRRGGW
jgi:hypothetical protein